MHARNVRMADKHQLCAARREILRSRALAVHVWEGTWVGQAAVRGYSAAVQLARIRQRSKPAKVVPGQHGMVPRNGFSGQVYEITGVHAPGNGIVMVPRDDDCRRPPDKRNRLGRKRPIAYNVAEAGNPVRTFAGSILQNPPQGGFIGVNVRDDSVSHGLAVLSGGGPAMRNQKYPPLSMISLMVSPWRTHENISTSFFSMPSARSSTS